jgi:hypothetical protein
MNTPIYILFGCTPVHYCESTKTIYLNNTYTGTYSNKICKKKIYLIKLSKLYAQNWSFHEGSTIAAHHSPDRNWRTWSWWVSGDGGTKRLISLCGLHGLKYFEILWRRSHVFNNLDD